MLCHHPGPARIPGSLVGPLNVGIHGLLPILGLHGAPVVGHFTVRHVVAPGLEHPDRTILLKLAGHALGQGLAVRLVLRRHRYDEAIGVARHPPRSGPSLTLADLWNPLLSRPLINVVFIRAKLESSRPGPRHTAAHSAHMTSGPRREGGL